MESRCFCFEGSSFDECLCYHLHLMGNIIVISILLLYDDLDDIVTIHSQILNMLLMDFLSMEHTLMKILMGLEQLKEWRPVIS